MQKVLNQNTMPCHCNLSELQTFWAVLMQALKEDCDDRVKNYKVCRKNNMSLYDAM